MKSKHKPQSAPETEYATAGSSQRKSNALRILRILVLVLVIPGALLIYFISSFYNWLPKDEDLIAHFKANREDITELVRRYRTYEPAQIGMHHLWEKEGDTPQLFERAKVVRISTGSGVWMPNPYSIETAEQIEKLREKRIYTSCNPRYQALSLEMRDSQYKGTATINWNGNFRHVRVWKDLRFYPEAPHIEGGMLIAPLSYRGKQPPGTRVLSSLDDFPPDWTPATCLLRQIEPQWFIRMCGG